MKFLSSANNETSPPNTSSSSHASMGEIFSVNSNVMFHVKVKQAWYDNEVGPMKQLNH